MDANSRILGLLLLQWISMSAAHKIIMIPWPWKSHVSPMYVIGQDLVHRGHDLYIVLPPSYPDFEKLKQTSFFNVIGYEIRKPDMYSIFPADDTFTMELVEYYSKTGVVEDMRANTAGLEEFCSNILSDDLLFKTLKDLELDLAIVDSFPCSRCNLVIPYRLDIPYISLTSQYEPWLYRNPGLPSVVPFPFAKYFTEKMTFLERVSNLYQLIEWSAFPGVSYMTDEFTAQYIPDKAFKTQVQLASEAKLWLVDTDVLMDYPRPVMANEIIVGGLTTKPAEPLADDLQQFMDGAKNGVVVMSFGSFNGLTTEHLKIFLEVFGQLEQRVILRSEEMPPAPDNVKILKWLPQNDLLGHKNTRLFITHCGANGQMEALYHGVPMLGFPINGDQFYNARRAEYRGYGLHMDILHFTQEELLKNIQIMMNNHSFQENIRTASTIFRSRGMTPRERATYWIEEVLNHGVDYLHSHALDMPWYEYLMVDIFALLLVLIHAAVFCIHCIIKRYICGKCCSRRQKAKTE